MNAPKRIWVDMLAVDFDSNPYDKPAENGPRKCEVEYILATEHDRIVAEKDAEIAAARDKALEDAATLANNRIRRWLEIEPPYNGDLDEAIALIEELPAAIRAMKGERG